ncbi:slit homolog 1 protein-like [Branchiostoma floridae]|uniref:Slit homolog 1 protein-like n=1 Tax=Branchiostoma floridae TaxID=7739 RepID=A0A9J7HER5_BRAFL|nr:slit homolog 1 protein-like [Branchiostoma floridae]
MFVMRNSFAVAILLMVAMLSKAAEYCPSVCRCYGNRAHCAHADLTEIPANFSQNTVYLHLEGNNISSVSKTRLARMTSLRQLYLMNNRITDRGVPSDAFVSNRNLRLLDLTENLLTAVPRGLMGLWQLGLANNKINRIPRGTLYPRLIGIAKIHLEGNYLTNDEISPRELSGLHTLQQVFLSDNRLREIPTFRSARLNHLYIGGNNISRILPDTFNGVTRLFYLDLSRNSLDNPGIETGAMNPLSYLLYLWLRENKLTRVPSGLPRSVKKLHLEGNLITAVESNAFTGMTRLRYLYLSNNSIDVIEPGAFTGLGGLQYLELSGNKLQQLTNGSFLGLSQLSVLIMENCNITVMHKGAFEGLQEVTTLDLAHSRIEIIQDDAFVGLIDVKTLRLERNRIRSLSKNAFKGLSAVTSINLAYNRIYDVENGAFVGVDYLRNLDLTGNRLTSLPAGLEDMRSLRSLVLTNNSITDIPDDMPPNTVSVLTLSSNPLGNARLSRLANIFPQLSSLYLADVGLQTVQEDDFKGMSNLQLLNLDDNNLSEIPGRPFDSLPSLSRIDIRNNLLTTVPIALQNLTTIQTLSLSGNQISALNNDSFQGLTNIRALFLSDNNVTEIESGVFKLMDRIFRIFLDGNVKLKTVDLNTFRVPSLRYVYLQNSGIETIYRGQPEEDLPPLQTMELRGNPLNCDCRLGWMLTSIIIKPDVTCFKPSDLRGLAVKNLFDDDFICPDPSSFVSTTTSSLGQTSFPVTQTASTAVQATTTEKRTTSTTKLTSKKTTDTTQHSSPQQTSSQPSTVIPCTLECQNGGQCVVMATNAQECRCEVGFTGRHCETPNQEEDITVTEINDTALKITWSSPVEDVPYKISVRENDDDAFKEETILPPGLSEYILKDLNPDMQYIVCITPVKEDLKYVIPISNGRCHKVTVHAQSSHAGKPGKGTAFGLTVVAICVLLVCAVLGVIFYRRKKRRQLEEREVFPKPEEDDHELQELNNLREQFVPDVVIHAKDASNYVRLEDEDKDLKKDNVSAEKLGNYVKLTEPVD